MISHNLQEVVEEVYVPCLCTRLYYITAEGGEACM